ncbi:MAG TPA: hypothetical protein VLG69_02895 [Candidatus Andersenbacteria bacterium]|nr:hypothetical protein [Candidatus Andersenbacteria bacterium]
MKGKVSKKQVAIRQRMVWVITAIVVLGVFAFIGNNTYTNLVKTAANPNAATLPDFCYNKTTNNVSYLCKLPTMRDALILKLFVDYEPIGLVPVDQNNNGSGPGNGGTGLYDGAHTAVAQYQGSCKAYCNCTFDTSPNQPASCPADGSHEFAPKVPPVCHYKLNVKVYDKKMNYFLQKYIGNPGNPSYAYEFEDSLFGAQHAASSLQTFGTDPLVAQHQENQCKLDTQDINCRSYCRDAISNNLQPLQETGKCIVKTPKDPLPDACNPPSPPPTPTPLQTCDPNTCRQHPTSTPLITH